MESTNERIDLESLKVREPILFFADVNLYAVSSVLLGLRLSRDVESPPSLASDIVFYLLYRMTLGIMGW